MRERRTPARRPNIEHLEPRFVMADIALPLVDGEIRLTNGELQVRGTEQSDIISVDAPSYLFIHVGAGTFAPATRAVIRDRTTGEVVNQALFATSGIRLVEVEAMGGDDVVRTPVQVPSSIRGGPGSDSLRGGSGEDLITGGTGRDFLYGGGGDDELLGQDGNDFLVGQSGDDVLEGGGGDDYLYGNDGGDLLFGGIGNDRMFGMDGDDDLYGATPAARPNPVFDVIAVPDSDFLFGGRGRDNLYGGPDIDILRGGDGNDGLFGGVGRDHLHGEGGADRLLVQGQWTAAGPDDQAADFLYDATSADAVIALYDTDAGRYKTHRETPLFEAGRFNDWDIETIDEALAAMHHRTNNTSLLKVGQQAVRIRKHGDAVEGESQALRGLYIRRQALISLYHNAFTSESRIRETTFHEFAHAFDHDNDRVSHQIGWRRLSGWIPRKFGLRPPAGFSRSGDGYWYYSSNAPFATRTNDGPGYAAHNPREDFATAFTLYFQVLLGQVESFDQEMAPKLGFIHGLLTDATSP